MTKTDLVGWTLAELAFVLLFAFVAVLAPVMRNENEKKKALADANQSAQEAATAELQVHDLLTRNKVLQDQLNRQNLRSEALPACSELDPDSGWLFTATIGSANTFELDGKRLTMPDILERYSKEMADAEKRQCRQRVRLYYAQGISVADYDSGLKLAESYFYIKRLGGM